MGKRKELSNGYYVCSILFVTCLLLSNIAAVKLIGIGPVTLSAAVVLFPITYIVNDLLAEVYGYAKARATIWMGFAMNLLMVAFFELTIVLPAPSYFAHQDAYSVILGNTPRVLVASLIAYLIGSTLNAKVMVALKRKEGASRGLFKRCILSTLIGESLDSIVFVTLAFIGTMPFNAMLIMIATQAGFKTLYEIVIFPATQAIIKKVKKAEGIY